MCTLLVYRRPVEGVDLAVAANRDELYRRPRGEWRQLSAEPEVVGGWDPESGGTWLAVSAAGFVVAVTNARLGARRREDDRSRGLLALDLALTESAAAAGRLLRREDLRRYAAVNVVVASRRGFWLASNEPKPRVEHSTDMAVGVGNKDMFTPDDRVAALLALGQPGREIAPAAYLDCLKATLARHLPPAACHHRDDGGTVASTVVLLARDHAASRIDHADGTACDGTWRRVR